MKTFVSSFIQCTCLGLSAIAISVGTDVQAAEPTAKGKGVICTETSGPKNGAFIAFSGGRGSSPDDFVWAGLSTLNQTIQRESEWPFGTYAGLSPYYEPVVLTIHSHSPSAEPTKEFRGTLTYFMYDEPQIAQVDCYFSE